MLIPKPQDLEQKELQSSPVRSTPRVPPLMTQTLIEEDTNDGQGSSYNTQFFFWYNTQKLSLLFFAGDVSAVEIVQNYMERVSVHYYSREPLLVKLAISLYYNNNIFNTL